MWQVEKGGKSAPLAEKGRAKLPLGGSEKLICGNWHEFKAEMFSLTFQAFNTLGILLGLISLHTGITVGGLGFEHEVDDPRNVVELRLTSSPFASQSLCSFFYLQKKIKRPGLPMN